MSLPSTTLLGTLALGTVGAVIAAGAALGGPGTTAPRSDQHPVVVTKPSALPCPAGTTERKGECLKVVVAPAEPAPAVPARARSAAPATTAGDSTSEEDSVEPSEAPETEQESDEVSEHEDAEDSSEEGSDDADSHEGDSPESDD